MRGKDRDLAAVADGQRITPAHAGKRLLGRLPGMGGPDHPRVCGEKDQVKSMSTEDVGSPPRMRGKGSINYPEGTARRITPAYAGKRLTVEIRLTRHKDHPRVCGEKYPGSTDPKDRWGSPPRMRGKVSDFTYRTFATRITPAYAGKSRPDFPDLRPAWDHPRICGEKSNSVICVLPFWDHPRICGEKLNHDRVPGVGKGSPPRMRGKVKGIKLFLRCAGITPAYAGKRLSHPVRVGMSRDHPRVCGEKFW